MWGWRTSPLPYAGNHNYLRNIPPLISGGYSISPAITVLIIMNESDGFIGIGTFSIVTRLTRRALRLYDEKGLLTPARRGITCYRQYSYQRIRRGIQLKRLSDLSFGIREMLEITDGTPASENALQPQALCPDGQMTESRNNAQMMCPNLSEQVHFKA